jgi:type VI secretion system protein ImpL
MSLPHWIYERIRREMARISLPEFSVAAVGGRDALQVFVWRSGEPLTRGVAGQFTLAGYRQFNEQLNKAISDVAQDSWVFSPQESVSGAARIEQIKAATEQLYFEDYIKQWDNLLGDVGSIRLASLDQAARVMTILSGTDSPLRRFLQAAARETTLEGALASKSAVESVSDAVKGKFNEYKAKLETVLASNADVPAPAVRSVNPVDLHFDALHKMVGLPDLGGHPAAGAAPIEAVISALAQVAQYFDASDSARRTGMPPPAAEVLTRLKREIDGKPGILVSMLQDIDTSGAGLTLGTERSRLNAMWAAVAAPFCRQAIAGRYPLVRDSAQDITPEDFGRYFGPGGIVDEFFQKNLLAQVNTSGSQWRWRPVGNLSSDLPQDVLNLFQRAARIREAFFASGGRQPSLRFELKPLAVDSAITQFSLDIDGQSLAYVRNKPVMPVAFAMPSGKGVGEVHLRVSVDGDEGMLKTEGAWSWFRMLDKGTFESTAQGERYKLGFDVGGRELTFELKASSVVNPFRRETLQQFRCIDHL